MVSMVVEPPQINLPTIASLILFEPPNKTTLLEIHHEAIQFLGFYESLKFVF